MRHLPNSVEKRDIIHGAKKMETSQVLELAKKFEAAGWLNDAVDFYAKAESVNDLMRLQSKALGEGDVFLTNKIRVLLKSEDKNILLKCAENALKLERFSSAMKAYEICGEEDKAQELKIRLGVIKAPEAPLNH